MRRNFEITFEKLRFPLRCYKVNLLQEKSEKVWDLDHNATSFVASHQLLPGKKWSHVMNLGSQNFSDLSCHSMTLERWHNCERFSHLVRSHQSISIQSRVWLNFKSFYSQLHLELSGWFLFKSQFLKYIFWFLHCQGCQKKYTIIMQCLN